MFLQKSVTTIFFNVQSILLFVFNKIVRQLLKRNFIKNFYRTEACTVVWIKNAPKKKRFEIGFVITKKTSLSWGNSHKKSKKKRILTFSVAFSGLKNVTFEKFGHFKQKLKHYFFLDLFHICMVDSQCTLIFVEIKIKKIFVLFRDIALGIFYIFAALALQ